MAVYFFIATPAQLWHHHDFAKEQVPIKNTTTSAFDTPGLAIDSDCQVCSHQYAAYIGYEALLFEAPVFCPQKLSDFHYTSILAIPSLNQINKGPPAFL